MIHKETIDKIFDASRIEEVVGDFITLKKRGINLLGLCPFHNEKTPSFTVSPVKGIYKCFGCGKGGNAVNFIMDHELLTYPDALRYLARKYNIEIEEEEQSPEELESQNARESLYIVSAFAQKQFTNDLYHTDEGKAIGLSYFRERGFREDIIEKFQLGYSIDKWRAFTDTALKAGYQLDYLVKAGLTIAGEEKTFDRFSGRVMFPIHNVTGRVIGFGGRTLKTDKKTSKYVNSPETDIYHKSFVLYGLYYAKKGIIAADNCYLVEGYTDVISMHQAGIENVVSSSGTSLTVEQIRLIRRYTQNITILYDGDNAGIKASFRGIDLVLEEGMNVKVLLFPDGEDPDSFSKRVSQEELKTFISENSKDFIAFKTQLLFEEVKHDPIKKATLIKEIVESVAIIPEAIMRSVYIKECSRIMDVDEQVLLSELNKIRRKKVTDTAKPESFAQEPILSSEGIDYSVEKKKEVLFDDCEEQEKEIIYFLLKYSDQKILTDAEDEEGRPTEVEVSVADFIIQDLNNDRIKFDNTLYQRFFDLYTNPELPTENYFIQHVEKEISQLAIDLVSSPHSLSDWERHGIFVITEDQFLKKAVLKTIYALKSKKIQKMLLENHRKIKDCKGDEEIMRLLVERKQLEEGKKLYSSLLGRPIIK